MFYGLIEVDTIAERDGLPQTEGMYVYVREKEICYKLVSSEWIVYFTGGAVPPEFGVDPSTVGPTPPLSYTNPIPTPTTVGGISSGSTFDNVELPDMWTKLLYPFQTPAFTAFTVSGIGTLEVGQALSAGNRTFSWTLINGVNVNSDGLTIRDQTENVTLASNLAVTGPVVLAVADKAGPTNTASQTWRIVGTSTAGSSFNRDYSFSWMWAVFHGESTSETLTGPDIQSLRVKRLLTASSGTYAMNGGGYKYIAYPTSMGLKSTFKDTSNNLDVAVEPAYTVTTTNSHGVATQYYVHRTTNMLGGSINILVS